MKNTIVTGSLIVFSDGFVWKRLSNEKAYKIWVSAENEDFELYKVRVDDESESLIESLEDLQDTFKQGHHVCIEVGKLPYSIGLNYLRNLQELSVEAKDLLNDPCLGKIFDKGEIDDEIVYNGNVEDIKVDWIRAIQNEVDKMNADKSMTKHNIINAVKYGICGYPYRFYIDSYSGYIVEYPITLIEWVQGLKPGTVIKIGNVFSYHY